MLLEEAPYLQGQEGGLNQERVPIAFVNNWIIHEHMLQFWTRGLLHLLWRETHEKKHFYFL
jgi:hypothetical protein